MAACRPVVGLPLKHRRAGHGVAALEHLAGSTVLPPVANVSTPTKRPIRRLSFALMYALGWCSWCQLKSRASIVISVIALAEPMMGDRRAVHHVAKASIRNGRRLASLRHRLPT